MNHKYTKFEDDINIINIFSDLYKRKFYYGLFILTISLITFLFLISTPNQFKSSSLISVKESYMSNEPSTALNAFASVASISGLGSGAGSSRKMYVLRLIESRDFFEYLINNDERFLIELMAFSSFDKKNQLNNYNEDVYNIKLSQWNKELFKNSKPTLLSAHKEFRPHFNIEGEEGLSNFMVLTITHESPLLAKKWLDYIISSFNIYVKDKESREAQLSLNYLNSIIGTVEISEIRSVIASLIKKEIQDLMIANSDDEYILNIIDKPFIPEKKSYPDRPFYFILSFIASIFLVLLFSIIFHQKKE
jgi:hypothetical protein